MTYKEMLDLVHGIQEIEGDVLLVTCEKRYCESIDKFMRDHNKHCLYLTPEQKVTVESLPIEFIEKALQYYGEKKLDH